MMPSSTLARVGSRAHVGSRARLTTLLSVVVSGLLAGVVPAAAHGPTRGLQVAATGDCAGGYRVVGTDLCTHGPDPRPAGRRMTVQPRAISASIEGPLPGAVLCDGDGRSGRRVQAIYARTASIESRRSTVIPQIRTLAAGVQSAFLASAARTDGVRRPRWVTDDDCRLAVIEVVLSEAARTSFGTTISELQGLGHARADRKYLIWFDTGVYCGIGTFWGDDRSGADNLSNTRVGYGRVDAGCWGWAESHELMHTLGAVQNSAPNTTWNVAPGAFGHCTDEYDVMCYPDAPGVTMTIRCPDRGLDGQFDCGNDDYFHTRPSGGSYLGSHWNTADSGWLERSVVELATPVPGLDAGALVSDGRVPVVTDLTARAPLAGIETVEAQRRSGGQAWQAVAAAVTDGTVGSRLAVGAATRFRVRAIDGAGTAGPWRLGPAVTARLRDDGHVSLAWSSSWRSVAIADTLGGRVRRSAVVGATLRFTTDARQVGIVATRGPTAGRLEIRVDGTLRRTLDLAADTTRRRSIVATLTLEPGRHEVALRVRAPLSSTPGWRVDLDALVLLTP